MKLLSITTIVAAFGFAAAAAADQEAELPHLRNGLIVHSSSTSESEVQAHRRLNCNTDLINAAIRVSLPTINRLIQAAITESIMLQSDPFEEKVELRAPPACNGKTATVSVQAVDITGFNSLEISRLEVQEGTEEVCCGMPTTFSGIFDFDLQTTKDVALNSKLDITTNADMGTGCDGIMTTGSSSISGLKGGGVIALSGTIENNQLKITEANVNSLTMGCGTVTTTYENLGNFEEVTDAINNRLGPQFCTFITSTVTPNLRTAINFGLKQLVNVWGYLTSAAYMARFVTANGPTIVRTFLSGDLSETMAENRAFLGEP